MTDAVTESETFFKSCGQIEIAIIDDGVGISAENLELLFGEFNQIDPHKNQKSGGTGLGKNICIIIIIILLKR